MKTLKQLRVRYSVVSYLNHLALAILSVCTVSAFSLSAFAQTPAPAPQQAQIPPSTPQAAQPKPSAPSVKSSLPGTSAHELAEVAQRDLTKLMSEGPCPCDPAKTLLDCIQAQVCPAATSLAEYGVTLYKAGLGSEQVTEAVINKFIQDFSPPAEFDLSQTPWKGAADAPITIVEFADFECPHCALMAEMMKEIVKERPGMVKLYFKQFPLPFHKLAPLASRATLAAHKQGAFWAMHDLIFSQQTKLTEEIFLQFAEQLGLNMMIFRSDYVAPEIAQQIESERAEGAKAGLEGTPTLFFNGRIYRGNPTKDAILSHIDMLIKEKSALKPAAK